MAGLPVVLLMVAVFYRPCNGHKPVMETAYGPIRGYAFVSNWTQQTVYAFQGIPYAAPPVGNLRFKDPVPPEKWTSIKDCTKDEDSCMQIDDPVLRKLNHPLRTSENCLYLNVYTPEVNNSNQLLPVMVWLHGGVFKEGSGSRFRYGPDFLVAEGVIVVTLNYRLGALGFLNLGISEVPGNAGLKDQRLALQWVQREIGKFGGDAGNVTLFGECAGAASAYLHYLSPLSKGLFHRMIGSSAASMKWAVRENGKAYGLRLASVLNCTTEDLSVTQQCLRTVPAEDILRAQGLVTVPHGDLFETLGLVFVPTVDKSSSNEPIVPDLPVNMIEKKLGSHVSILMSVTGQEGRLKLYTNEEEDNKTHIRLNKDFFTPWEKRNADDVSKFRILYDEALKPLFESRDGFRRKRYLHSYRIDTFFHYFTTVCIKEYIQRGPLYVYGFHFEGNFEEIPDTLIEDDYNITGISHAPETLYLFVLGKANQTPAEGSKDVLTRKRIVRLWTNFAKFGTPTKGEDSLLQNVNWAPTGSDIYNLNFLQIDDNLKMTKVFFQGLCAQV